MSENKKIDFLASFNRDFLQKWHFYRAHTYEIIGFQWYVSFLPTKSSTLSKSKHLLWGRDSSWEHRTTLKSLFLHFLYHQKYSLCAVWGVVVYDNGLLLRSMGWYIMNNMELGIFTNIIDIFSIKIRFFKIKIWTLGTIFSLWGPKTAYHEVIEYHFNPILVP